MKINIAGGTGIMGKVHRPLFENNGHGVIFSGRSTSPNLEEAAQISDLTIVSVPIPVTEEIIRRVAPYSKAIMDFTGVKVSPIEAMLKYSNKGCEVGGLHPLYGDIKSFEGKTAVYCQTNRSKEKCDMIIKAFENSGVKIKRMDPHIHDLHVGGISQNARSIIFEVFALLMERYNLNARDLYDISPPPTRILLDLIARQVDSKNDELYQDMRDYNPSTAQITQYLAEALGETSKKDVPQKIRNLFGEDLLKEAQSRAKDLIDKKNS